MNMKFLFLISFCCVQTFATPIKKLRSADTNCGYESCNPIDSNKINVHLIPHSHDDVGWLKTYDQYYFGSHNDIARAGVQYIISSTIEALKDNPERRFIQVETAFFWKWWERQTDETKQDVIDLVNNGRLEIINAAWSMNDEAAVNYHSTIDQFTWGLRFINDTLGTCGTPKIGWQIDPFGHSREQASIFAQLGYEGVFFARLDYKDKEQRIKDKTLEVLWKGSANLENTDIFTNIFPDFYFSPGGFCFDITCGDTMMIDDEDSPDYNMQQRMEEFANIINGWSNYYQTKNIFVPMGGDFQYISAEVNFINMDRLIKAFENHDTIKVLYSTPSCYLKAVNDMSNDNGVSYVQKTDDFFPYGSDEHCYWTGYFTSRPNAKRFERIANNILQVAKQLGSFSKLNGNEYEDKITPLRQSIGVLQHHDAITGTAKQAVANDYSRLLYRDIKKTESLISSTIIDLLKKDSTSEVPLDFQFCLLTNTSVCVKTNSGRFVAAVYNPLERPVTSYIRLPVDDGSYTVTGPDGEESNEVLDAIDSFEYVHGIEGIPKAKDLVFAARDVPAFGAKLYYIDKSSSIPTKKSKDSPLKRYGTDTTNFEINTDSGLLSSVTMNGKTLEITQNFFYYRGSNGDNSNNEARASGAYIFRPIENDATPITTDTVTITSTETELVDEVKQTFNDWVTQIIRVYKGDSDNYIEFDWLVGPIEVDEDNGIGKEIVSRFTVNNFNNNEVFYTDSNGRELIKRQVNTRSDYEYDSSLEPVASNYYPVTSKILMKDEDQKVQIAILNDRAQGGGTVTSGVLELMVHRRLLRDDAKGVDEALNDQEFRQGIVARGQHYLVIGSTDNAVDGGKSTAALEREIALKKLLQPIVLVGDASKDELSLDNIQSLLTFNYAGLQKSLPDNIHILTLEPWKDDSYLLRLEHILESNEDNILSQSTTVDITDLFSGFDVTEIRETTLGANQWLDDYENKGKLQWTIKGGDKISYIKRANVKDDPQEISLNPMQIRTFVMKVSKK